MLGLINRSIQNFLTDTYGPDLWRQVAHRLGAPAEGYEPMLRYPDRETLGLLKAAGAELRRSRSELLEDLGAYLTTCEPVRRLLRYGGQDFAGFLYSLNELHGRARMALADLDLPELDLVEIGLGEYRLTVEAPHPGWGAVMAGLMRAMADDYGALAVIEMPTDCDMEAVHIRLLDCRHSEARGFRLSHHVGAQG